MTTKLNKAAGSNLSKIRVIYNAETFKFNLFNEVKIRESLLDDELKNQPSYFGFLFLLQKKLNTKFEELKLERKRLYAELYLKAKALETPHGRPMNDEMCKSWAITQESYQKISQDCLKAKDDTDTVLAAVKAFEQRKDLMQTLASNQRVERKL